MHELLILIVVAAVVMAATTFAVRFVGPVLRTVEYALACGSILVILFVAFFVGAEVLMRYAFNAPIQGHLELAELMMPVIVFLALSYTQATHGHVGMDLLTDMLPPRAQFYASVITRLTSIFICAVIGYFSFKNAHQLWLYDDVTMSPPYVKTWPAAAAIPLGYMLVSLRLYLQTLHIIDPERFPTHEPPDADLYKVE